MLAGVAVVAAAVVVVAAMQAVAVAARPLASGDKSRLAAVPTYLAALDTSPSR